VWGRWGRRLGAGRLWRGAAVRPAVVDANFAKYLGDPFLLLADWYLSVKKGH
jgi:hypothetical protein